MPRISRAVFVALTLALSLHARRSEAQTRSLTACTPDVRRVCAELRIASLTSGFFQIGVRTIGTAADPLLAVTTYNLVFSTGAASAPGSVTRLLGPVAEGGAVVRDASDWELFDSGDLLFLSALSNRGIGGCATAADVGGFGQAATTCGASQFATFTFLPTRTFDPNAFGILDLEFALLTNPVGGASCGSSSAPCILAVDPPTSTVPEPSTVLLAGAGLAATAFVFRRRSV